MSASMNAMETELLVSYLISQGYSRARAEDMVKTDPAGVRTQFEQSRAASQGQ